MIIYKIRRECMYIYDIYIYIYIEREREREREREIERDLTIISGLALFS